MRVLMINHEFTITGSSTAFFRLAAHLRRSGHDVVVLPINPAHGPMSDRYAAVGIAIETTIDLTKFDVVLANTICAAPIVIRIRNQLPTIWFVNEAEVALVLLQRNPAWIEAFHRAAAVIFNMPFQHDVFRSFTYALDRGKFHSIPFGVDVDTSRIARTRIPQKAAALRVVQVGTIEPRKRPGDLIRAVSRMSEDVECVICGKLIQIEADAREIVDADPAHYRLLDGLPDEEVLGWVESADVFVLASGSETQALAAYEAAALARPIILSDLPCYHGVFSHGRNCLLYPPGHVEMLSQSIGMLMRSAALRDSLGRAAQQTALRYSNRAFFAQFDMLMQKTVEGR